MSIKYADTGNKTWITSQEIEDILLQTEDDDNDEELETTSIMRLEVPDAIKWLNVDPGNRYYKFYFYKSIFYYNYYNNFLMLLFLSIKKNVFRKTIYWIISS